MVGKTYKQITMQICEEKIDCSKVPAVYLKISSLFKYRQFQKVFEANIQYGYSWFNKI